jgi:hypothetical protein
MRAAGPSESSLCLYYDISAKLAEVAMYFTDRGIEELGERRLAG